MNKYALGLSTLLLLASCRKTEVINKIENMVELGTYDASSFLSNTVDERALVLNYQTLLDEIATGKSGSLQDSLDQKKSKTLNAQRLQGLLIAKVGLLSVDNLVTKEYKEWILGDSVYMKRIAASSANSHFNPRVIMQGENELGGRYRQYYGFLFDPYGFDTYEVTKNAFLSISYQKVFNELLTKEKVSQANIDKALVFYGAPTFFPNGLTTLSSNGSLVKDKSVALYAAQRDNAYGAAKGGYYSIIKTQFISLQKQLKTNAQNTTAVIKNIDSIRVNWEKALMATAVHHLDQASSNMSGTIVSDSLYAQALYNATIASSIIRSFRGLTAPRIITDTDVNETLALLYASHPSVSENLRQLMVQPARIQNAIIKLKTVYKFSDIQIGDYFKKNDIDSRNIGARRD